MSKKGYNETNMFKSSGLGDAGSSGYWGEITANDKKMVDKGWHRFWSMRGLSPPSGNSLGHTFSKRKKRDNSTIDTSEKE